MECGLDQKKCVPCKSDVTPLSFAQATALLSQTPGWAFTNAHQAISRKFTFEDFKQSLAFVNKIGEIAEDEGHHADISFGWGYVEISLTTHTIGGCTKMILLLLVKSMVCKRKMRLRYD